MSGAGQVLRALASRAQASTRPSPASLRKNRALLRIGRLPVEPDGYRPVTAGHEWSPPAGGKRGGTAVPPGPTPGAVVLARTLRETNDEEHQIGRAHV